MKIYEIGTGYTPIPAKMGAATEIVVEELTKALLQEGEDVKIIDIQSKNRDKTNLPLIEVRVSSAFSGTDISLGIMHRLKRVVYSVKLAGVLKRILKKENERVVLHFHNQYNMFFFLKLTPGSLQKKCVTAYTNHSGIWRMDWEKIKGTIKKKYFQEAFCQKHANKVYVLNSETRAQIMRHLGVSEENIYLISNGVNTKEYIPMPSGETGKATYQYKFSDKNVILQIGSVYENKGQLRALEMLCPLMKKNSSLVYVYAGGVVSQEYQNQIKRFVKTNKLDCQVFYMGMIHPGQELNLLYNTAFAAILPSRFEAFSLAAIESMSAGLPVLVPENGPFMLGKGSLEYNEKNFESMVMMLLNEEIRAQYSKLARENAVQNYSWNRIAKEYIDSWHKD